MSGAVRPIIREVRESVLNGFTHVKDKLHHLLDNLSGHFDDVMRGVRDVDVFDGKRDTPNLPHSHRPGFNADGSIDPEAFRTPRDGAFYWSGMYPRNGQEIAGRIAADNNGTTLEMLIEARGIEMPEWDADNPAAVATWTQVSEAYASGASGTVRAVLGDNIRPDAVWWAELERLKSNPEVTQVVRIDPDTLIQSVIWPE
ncbi:hypothetical protein [Microbacterium sp.]|jgi:hypothetical protein|uniref:hypothetical protein n=1 Tax=Microbacterium sp. TaxID=51671 RepID=UPI002CA8E958|nr:hypothetical protein [Microbacterium sp.]HWL76636.1 hypothetical protein [Microbacterium sp.]